MKKYLLITFCFIALVANAECKKYEKSVETIKTHVSLNLSCPTGAHLSSIACSIIDGDGTTESEIRNDRRASCEFNNYVSDIGEWLDTKKPDFGKDRIQILCCKN